MNGSNIPNIIAALAYAAEDLDSPETQHLKGMLLAAKSVVEALQ